MTSLTQWTWVWVNSGSWWWTGRPRVLQSTGTQRVGHNWATELNWTEVLFQTNITRPQTSLLKAVLKEKFHLKGKWSKMEGLGEREGWWAQEAVFGWQQINGGSVGQNSPANPPGSPIPGILQARTLEWVAISFSSAWKEKWKWSRSVVFDS